MQVNSIIEKWEYFLIMSTVCGVLSCYYLFMEYPLINEKVFYFGILTAALVGLYLIEKL